MRMGRRFLIILPNKDIFMLSGNKTNPPLFYLRRIRMNLEIVYNSLKKTYLLRRDRKFVFIKNNSGRELELKCIIRPMINLTLSYYLLILKICTMMLQGDTSRSSPLLPKQFSDPLSGCPCFLNV